MFQVRIILNTYTELVKTGILGNFISFSKDSRQPFNIKAGSYCPRFFPHSAQSWSGVSTLFPPMYICSGFGMDTDPSACRLFSRNAISILGVATQVLFKV